MLYIIRRAMINFLSNKKFKKLYFLFLKPSKMKKIILSLLVLALVGFISCKKDNTNSVKYVNAISGVFKAVDNDLKASPVGADRVWEVYKKVGNTYVPVDGSEFIPGSSANLDWIQHPWPQTFALNSDVKIDYCPVMPLRIVTKTRLNNENKSVAYLGILDFTPDRALFPVSIVGRRLGDVLTVNVDDLRNTPGYSFNVVIEYRTSEICIPGCLAASSSTTNGWPTLGFKQANRDLLNTFVVDHSGDVTVYDGVEKKIVGPIVIKITDPGNRINIVKTVDALSAGKGLALTIKTDKAGWYDTAKIMIEDKDIIVEQREVNIDDGQVPN